MENERGELVDRKHHPMRAFWQFAIAKPTIAANLSQDR
jgi:hypothetical protein